MAEASFGMDDDPVARSPSLCFCYDNESEIAAGKQRKNKTKQLDATKRGLSVKRRCNSKAASKKADGNAQAQLRADAAEHRTRRAAKRKRGGEATQPDDAEREFVVERTREDATKHPDAIERGVAVKRKRREEASQFDCKECENQVKQPGAKTRGTSTEPPDAEERGRATEKAYDCSLPRINGLLSIVRIFAVSWFPPEVSELLHRGASMLVIGGDSSTQQAVASFTETFLRIDGRPNELWNTGLTDALSQLCKIRKFYKNEFEPLSESETTECMWTFARKYLLQPYTQELPKRKQRPLFNHAVNQAVGCRHRLRAVVKMGSHGFDNVYDEDVLLLRLVHYIETVEREAERYINEGKRMHEVQQMVPPSQNIYLDLDQDLDAARSGAHSCAPSCAPARGAYESSDQEIGGESFVLPALQSQDLQQDSMPPSRNMWRPSMNVNLSSDALVLKSTPKWAPRPRHGVGSAPWSAQYQLILRRHAAGPSSKRGALNCCPQPMT